MTAPTRVLRRINSFRATWHYRWHSRQFENQIIAGTIVCGMIMAAISLFLASGSSL